MLFQTPYRTWRASFDPFRELDRVRRELETPFDGYGPDYPAVNVWTSADEAVLSAEIPGVEPSNLEISVVGDTVTLKGTVPPTQASEGQTLHRQERTHGQFSRSLRLPFQIEAERVDAKIANGVLNLRLPRAVADMPRKIEVKAA